MSARKIILILVIFVLLSVISEVLFLYNNPTYLDSFFFKQSQNYAKKNDAQKAINYLSIVSNLTINQSRRNYPKVVPKNFEASIKLPGNNQDLNKDISKYLMTIDFSTLEKDRKYTMSRMFYDMGNIAYKDNEPKLFESFLQVSYYEDPNTSFWPVELANYYYLSGNKETAENTLKKCMELTDPRKHCQDYLDYINSNKPVNKPGFLIDETRKYFQYPSVLKNLSNF